MQDNKSFERRLAALERRNKYLLTALFISAGFFIVFSCQSNQTVKSFTASEFNVADSTGKIVAQLKLSMDGPGLFILDEEGRERLVAIHQKDQTGFFVLDENGDTRVGAAHFAHGGSGFALHGKNVKGAAVLYYKDGGTLSFYDTAGTVLERIPGK